MKTIILILLLISAFTIHSQIPEGYYYGTDNLTGVELKTALYNIIKGHTEFPYTSSGTDVWDILKVTDLDPGNSENVIQIYTGWSINGPLEYNNGTGWEREHIWAKVHGGFDINPPAGTDVHHLRPIDGSVNSKRNSRWFADCNIEYYADGVATGCYYSNTEWTWEPRDQDKGDVARMIFYMATRYEGENDEPDLEIVDYIPANNNDPAPIMAKLSYLLEWNHLDTVDDWERNRNNIIYTYYQHNRNPFIDHPEFADLIWVPQVNYVENLINFDFEIFPNPADNEITIKSMNSDLSNAVEIKILNILGETLLTKKTNEFPEKFDISNYNSGCYIIKIIQGETVVNKPIIGL